MWDRDLVARLSPKGSQVLLSLLLSRSHSVQQSSAEFAKTTGLGQRSIAPALLELRDAGLIQIIAQPGKPPVVSLVHPEEYGYETSVVEVGPEHLGTAETTALPAPGSGVGVDGRETGPGSIQGVGAGSVPPWKEGPGDVQGRSENDRLAIEAGLLNNCQLADEGQDRALRVAALQDVWDFAFPYADYPSQRLTNDAAKRLLVNRSAEHVGRVILESVSHATQRIQSPRAYIEAALSNEDRRATMKEAGISSSGIESIINDDLRKLAKLGRSQFRAQSEDSPGDKP